MALSPSQDIDYTDRIFNDQGVDSFDPRTSMELDDRQFENLIFYAGLLGGDFDDSMLQRPEIFSSLLQLFGPNSLDDDQEMDDYDGWTGVTQLLIGNDQVPVVHAESSTIETLMEKVKVEDHQQCTICLNEILVGCLATRMSCSHIYHETCIVEWLKNSITCPNCRHKIFPAAA